MELATPNVKQIMNFNHIFQDHINHNYPHHLQLYTDGSKSEIGVGAAALFGNTKRQISLPKEASVYTAELHALQMACHLIHEHPSNTNNSYIICTDSLSAVQGLHTLTPRNHLMHKLQISFHTLLDIGISVTVLWIPGHREIKGNEKADEAARSAAQREAAFIPIPYTDFYPSIKEATLSNWTNRWNTINNHTSKIRSTPGKWKKLITSRKIGVIINRLRLGHTNISHSYLMDVTTHGQRPICPWCNDSTLTIAHVLINCIAIEPQRTTALSHLPNRPLNLQDVLGNDANIAATLQFLKTLNILNEI